MTPERIEEAFKKWLQDNYMVETEWGNPEKTIPRMAWKAAWLEATRQAYELCAKIADEAEIKMLKKLLLSQGLTESIISKQLKDCLTDSGEAIRAKAKELDNGN